MNTPDNALPNYDKAEIQDPAAFFRTLFHLRDIREERAVPAIVTDYDAKTGFVTVIPMPKYTFDTRDGEVEVDREKVIVRTLRFFHGGYVISLPILKGDTGWLISGDRNCASSMKKNGKILEKDLEDDEAEKGTMKPDDGTLLSFSNRFFLPFSFANAPETIGEGFVIRKFREDDEDEEDFTEIRIADDAITVKNKKVSAKVTAESVEVVRDDEKLTLDENGLSFDGKNDEDVNIITDIRYDIGSHQIQKKIRPSERRGTFITKVGKESDWIVVEGGQAVPEQTSGN